MPEISFSKVISFSSEDKSHPAENLLRPSGSFKWKCASAGEKNATVLLQLDQSVQINSIDIGNEGSAFVEVLVGRSSTSSSQDFQVLLVASSFMTPVESRNGTNRNAVRFFGPDKLCKTACDQKWDCVKVVCTQPFCKTSTYGLSFIKLHSLQSTTHTVIPPATQGVKKLGAFSLRDDPDTSLPIGSLFAARNQDKVDSSSPIAKATNLNLTKDTPGKTHQRTVEQSQISKRKSDESCPTQTRDKKPKVSGESRSNTAAAKQRQKTQTPTPSQSRTKQPSPSTNLSPTVPFHQVLKGVTFVLSGYQNPERREIREKGLEMGALYKGDWDGSCTHLICAFANTPKYNQVKGKGRIVSANWITDCHKKKRKQPWRTYRLGTAETPDNSDEDQPMDAVKPQISKPKENKRISEQKNSSTVSYPESSEDTDDELQRLSRTNDNRETKESKDVINIDEDDDDEIFNRSTDKDDDDEDVTKLPRLPDFFTNQTFYLHGKFLPSERRALLRFIVGFNGKLEDRVTDKVNFALTHDNWDNSFDQALTSSPSLTFVRPQWVYACGQSGQFVPHKSYLVIADV